MTYILWDRNETNLNWYGPLRDFHFLLLLFKPGPSFPDLPGLWMQKSLWKSKTFVSTIHSSSIIWNLRVPELQMSYSELTSM